MRKGNCVRGKSFVAKLVTSFLIDFYILFKE